MLIADMRLEDVVAKGSDEGSSVKLGSSRIEPFRSRLIQSNLRSRGPVTEVWVGEGEVPGPSSAVQTCDLNQLRANTTQEGLIVAFSRLDGGPTIQVARTLAGSCPIYVTSKANRLNVSWRFEDAALNTPDRAPNKEACRIYLKHGPGQVREQVIAGVQMLWPGEMLTFSENGLRFQEASVPGIVTSNTLTDTARATDELVRMIADAMQPGLRRAENPVLELSGGYDSSCVAVAAASRRLRLASYGLVHQGAIGRQQRVRRAELVELLGLLDHDYPSHVPSPLAALDVEEATFTPLDDNHRLPCAYAVDEHPAGPFDMIVTGVGGDELSMENTYRREEWEVAGSVCTSSLVTATARADMFMRRGIWPANPLMSQPVVDFCRALPRRMRSGRLLNILLLARAGLSDGFLFPRYMEHYGVGMQFEAGLYDFDEVLSECMVSDYGIFDVEPRLKQAREASNGGFSYKLICDLFVIVKLERVLRRYLS